ncbi:uncharacterized protein LOC123562139 [Mercenaria mercenaria]|uniref:uncharacterized protein LOC123562139 n=1 Tax=Mercenaria mercenaria TaxID=6596 RepID=UPI00234F4FFB|nr:uncharacterized protein LOC123562139 [Mercenaria mercenaria]
MNELNNYLEEETIVSLFKNPEQEVLNVIISAGKNLNEVIVVRTEQTLLHCAVEHQYEMVAATLLGYGMNGLTKDKSGETALGLAIKRKKSDSMSALIARSMKPLELRILFGLLWEEDENKDQVEKELDLNEDLLNSNCYFTVTLFSLYMYFQIY